MAARTERPHEFLSPITVARRMGVHRNTVAYWIKQKLVPFRQWRTPKAIRYQIDWTVLKKQMYGRVQERQRILTPTKAGTKCAICKRRAPMPDELFCFDCLNGKPVFEGEAEEMVPSPKPKRKSTYRA